MRTTNDEKDRARDREDDGIVILKQTRPDVCGGTDASLDTRAPKQICSEDMILFDVESALGYVTDDNPETRKRPPLNFVSAFAVPCGSGSFLCFESDRGYRKEKTKRVLAVVRESVFPELTALVRSCDLARSNGYHSQTHGLPENFGGHVCVRYASGERIDFSDNQSPVLSLEEAERIAGFFENAVRGEKCTAQDTALLSSVTFEEKREKGCFTRATLRIHPDGTGTNQKTSCYDGSKVYQSEKPVDAGTVTAIKNSIDECAMLFWRQLPDSGFRFGREKTIVCEFSNGEKVVVPSGRALPSNVDKGFFNIELELSVKN